MCESLRSAQAIFNNGTATEQKKVLFLLSDGQSADGDPLPIADRLHALGVTIVTCFLTSDPIENPWILVGRLMKRES